MLYIEYVSSHNRWPWLKETLRKRAAGPNPVGKRACRDGIRAAQKFLKIKDNNRKKMISRGFICGGWGRMMDDVPISFDNLSISKTDQIRPLGRPAIS
jgi:hypothetical protein